MKAIFNLPRNLRLLFGFLQGLILLGALLQLIFCLVYPLVHVSVPRDETIASVSLTPDPGFIRLRSSIADTAEVTLATLGGTLNVKFAGESAVFASLLRWQFFLCQTVEFAFCFLLFGLLHRLCANVEQGDIFSTRNTQLVRNLGLAILGSQVIGIGTHMWYTHLIDRFVKQYVVLDGIQMHASATTGWFSPSASLIITGCLVLLLAEVFRQGLTLKSENELTV